MFKKTVKYTNFNDVEVERDFYFHLSKAELISYGGDGQTLQDRIKKMIDTEDIAGILEEIKILVKLAVGVRSEDGERFIKNEETQSRLLDSPAFDELLFELISDAKKSAEFISNLLPEKLRKELEAAERASQDNKDLFANPDDQPAWIKENREPTKAELQSMSHEQLSAAFLARNRQHDPQRNDYA